MSLDFHKLGFCPYAAGAFIAKSPKTLSGLVHEGSFPDNTIQFGEAEMYRVTLENSRSGVAVAAIWIALRRMGLEGLRQYILYQLEVCEAMKHLLRTRFPSDFEVINEHSNNCEIVIKPHFGLPQSWDELQHASHEAQTIYSQRCRQLIDYVWYAKLREQPFKTPVIGLVSLYVRTANEAGLPALLLYPSSLHYDNQNVEQMLLALQKVKAEFEREHPREPSDISGSQTKIITPPR